MLPSQALRGARSQDATPHSPPPTVRSYRPFSSRLVVGSVRKPPTLRWFPRADTVTVNELESNERRCGPCWSRDGHAAVRLWHSFHSEDPRPLIRSSPETASHKVLEKIRDTPRSAGRRFMGLASGRAPEETQVVSSMGSSIEATRPKPGEQDHGKTRRGHETTQARSPVQDIYKKLQHHELCINSCRQKMHRFPPLFPRPQA